MPTAASENAINASWLIIIGVLNNTITVQGGLLMGIYASIEDFGFVRYIIGSTRRRTIVNKLVVIFF